jgi:hypothetical protein
MYGFTEEEELQNRYEYWKMKQEELKWRKSWLRWFCYAVVAFTIFSHCIV